MMVWVRCMRNSCGNILQTVVRVRPVASQMSATNVSSQLSVRELTLNPKVLKKNVDLEGKSGTNRADCRRPIFCFLLVVACLGMLLYWWKSILSLIPPLSTYRPSDHWEPRIKTPHVFGKNDWSTFNSGFGKWLELMRLGLGGGVRDPPMIDWATRWKIMSLHHSLVL